ncbi:hypothetical protein C8J57DRAFT_1050902 [Mycena rebaudengoi]|nr:hypothetical protein C8J57DRAFT_1050902 [Mycena rebaudengoi]
MLDVGSVQCASELCRELDFLPILCRCDRYFCSQHSSADAHACPFNRVAEPSLEPGSSKLQRCAVEKCNNPSLESFIASDSMGRTPAVCPHCQAAFCAQHRHPKSHSCQIIPFAEPKNAAARALLAKNFPSTSKTKAAPLHRPSKIPTDPIKLAQYQKIENMKLRGRAVPADPKDKLAGVPQGERVHMKVLCEDGSEKAFWVRNTLATGRVLDLLASQLGLSSESSVRCDDKY